MKAVQIHGYGGSDVLAYEDVPRPEPAEGEVLVHVRAASASPIDWKSREGYLRAWGIDLPMPTILGRDFAGDVVAVGDGVTDYKVGDAVFGCVGELHRGSYADYIVVRPDEIATKPASIDYDTAAAIPHSGQAAWQTLMEAGRLAPGQTVLIHAAAGGVGSLAVQIAKARGARVIGTSSEGNLEFVRSLGADEVVDYNNARFEDVAHDVDVVLDTIGGETQERSWALIKPGGVMVSLVGFAPGSIETGAERGVRAEMVAQRPEPEHLRTLGTMIDEGQIRPVVNRVMPLSEVRQAQDLMQDGHVRGKIILHFNSDED
jgi:NADPH:quinone reductase-like Zn-dependent oxidoreductase